MYSCLTQVHDLRSSDWFGSKSVDHHVQFKERENISNNIKNLPRVVYLKVKLLQTLFKYGDVFERARLINYPHADDQEKKRKVPCRDMMFIF